MEYNFLFLSLLSFILCNPYYIMETPSIKRLSRAEDTPENVKSLPNYTPSQEGQIETATVRTKRRKSNRNKRIYASKTPTIKSKSVTKFTPDEIKSIPNYKPEKAGDNQAQRTKRKKRVSKRKAKAISNQAAFINGEINDEGRNKKSKKMSLQVYYYNTPYCMLLFIIEI